MMTSQQQMNELHDEMSVADAVLEAEAAAAMTDDECRRCDTIAFQMRQQTPPLQHITL